LIKANSFRINGGIIRKLLSKYQAISLITYFFWRKNRKSALIYDIIIFQFLSIPPKNNAQIFSENTIFNTRKAIKNDGFYAKNELECVII